MEQIFNPRRLEKALIFRCLNASSLAEELNVSRQTVSGYKNGKVVPRIEQVHDIARVLKMPIKFFYEQDYKESISPVYFRSQLSTKKTYREYQKVKIEKSGEVSNPEEDERREEDRKTNPQVYDLRICFLFTAAL